ncbi:hypothetical protein ES708_26109 [subsurface metagenome]
MNTIVVPVDGASNIKLEALDFDTFATVYSCVSDSPSTEVDGLKYNCTGEECSWFDRSIRHMPEELKTVSVIAPVARGASGGFVGPDNRMTEVPGEGLTLAYTQDYPDEVDSVFRERAGNADSFFTETGSIRDFPGSLTLIKRFLFEEMERPEVLERSSCFGTYGALLTGHFLGDDYLRAVRAAGNEHGYWMCHTGARNINGNPGKPSSLCSKISAFREMVPSEASVVYKSVGTMPEKLSASLGISGALNVIPGGHDTCLSHIPVMSTFFQSFEENANAPVIHLEAGSWTLAAKIGGSADFPPDGHSRDIVVQGTVDGYPVVTARYGGGNDFRYTKRLSEEKGIRFGGGYDEGLLIDVAGRADCFVLPNINPVNHRTGPFPKVCGSIINEAALHENPGIAQVVTNLMTAVTTSCLIESIAGDDDIPIVITAGGSRDPYYGKLVATLTGKKVYAMYDSDGNAISETTTLGAAICGKAACLGVHPYKVDVSGLGVTYRELTPYENAVSDRLYHYRRRLISEIEKRSFRL